MKVFTDGNVLCQRGCAEGQRLQPTSSQAYVMAVLGAAPATE